MLFLLFPRFLFSPSLLLSFSPSLLLSFSPSLLPLIFLFLISFPSLPSSSSPSPSPSLSLPQYTGSYINMKKSQQLKEQQAVPSPSSSLPPLSPFSLPPPSPLSPKEKKFYDSEILSLELLILSLYYLPSPPKKQTKKGGKGGKEGGRGGKGEGGGEGGEKGLEKNLLAYYGDFVGESCGDCGGVEVSSTLGAGIYI